MSASGAISLIGSDCDTSSACVARNSTWPESSTTETMVVGEGMLEASEPQRNTGLTSPTSVPETPPCSMRRSMKVRGGRARRAALTMVGRPARRLSRSSADSVGRSSRWPNTGQVRAVVARELERHEAPARQEVDPGTQEAGGLGRALGAAELEQDTRRDAAEGGVEQQQPLVHGQAQRFVGLVQPALGLASELTGDVAVGDRRDDRHRKQRASDEQQEEAAPEPALQRCRS